MKLRVLDHTGDTLMMDTKIEGVDRVKIMSSKEIEKEFDNLIKEGYMPINDETDKIHVGRITKTDSITMLYPIIGG